MTARNPPRGPSSSRTAGLEEIGVEEFVSINTHSRQKTIEQYHLHHIEVLGILRMKMLTETMLDKGLPDEVITVTDNDAREMAYRLCKEEGLFCGMSSGANVYAAIQTAKKLGRDAKVVTVLVDRRDRYFSEHPTEHYII